MFFLVLQSSQRGHFVWLTWLTNVNHLPKFLSLPPTAYSHLGMKIGEVTRAFGSSLEVVVRISVAEVHSGTLRMAAGSIWSHGRFRAFQSSQVGNAYFMYVVLKTEAEKVGGFFFWRDMRCKVIGTSPGRQGRESEGRSARAGAQHCWGGLGIWPCREKKAIKSNRIIPNPQFFKMPPANLRLFVYFYIKFCPQFLVLSSCGKEILWTSQWSMWWRTLCFWCRSDQRYWCYRNFRKKREAQVEELVKSSTAEDENTTLSPKARQGAGGQEPQSTEHWILVPRQVTLNESVSHWGNLL